MSADDETSVWEVSRFFVQSLQRRNDIVTSQTHAWNTCECWMLMNWFDVVLFISLTKPVELASVWRFTTMTCLHIDPWTEGLSEQMHNLTDRYPDCCNYWLISRLSVWMYILIDSPLYTSGEWVPNEWVTDCTSESVTWWWMECCGIKLSKRIWDECLTDIISEPVYDVIEWETR